MDKNLSIEPELFSMSSNNQFNMYMKGLESSIEQFKQLYPEKYAKAQSIGDDMMNKKYELYIGQDYKGDLLKCKSLLLTINHYGLEESDLYQNEIDLLKKVLTILKMNNLDNINIILKDYDKVNKIIESINILICLSENDY
jgi:hypothetical protein